MNKWIVGFAKALGEGRYSQFSSSIAQVRHRCYVIKGFHAKAGVLIGDDREKGRQRVWTEEAQRSKRPAAGERGVCLVHKPTQFVQGWRRSCPQDAEGGNGPRGESRGSLAGYQVVNVLAKREVSSGEPVAEGVFGRRWLELNPFDEEWNSGSADVVNSVRSFVVFSVWECGSEDGSRGDAQQKDPIVEGMSVVEWLRNGGGVCEKDDQGDHHNNDAKEDDSLLSHGWTLPRKEAWSEGIDKPRCKGPQKEDSQELPTLRLAAGFGTKLGQF